MGVMLLWGFNFVALKVLFEDGRVSPATAALGRWFLMSVFLVGFCLVKKLPMKFPREGAWRLHFQGFLAMGVYMVFFTLGMKYVDAGVGAIILGSSPVFTLLFAVLVGQERFRLLILIGTLLAFAGVSSVILFNPNSQPGTTTFFGSMLIFTSAIIWAVGTIISKPLVTKMDPIVMTTLTMPAGLLALIPFGWRDFAGTDWLHLPAVDWAMLLYFSIGAGALGFMGFYKGVQQVGAAGAMLYQYFVAPLAVFSGWLVYRQSLSLGQFVGLAVVILGVWLANRARTQASLEIAAEAA